MTTNTTPIPNTIGVIQTWGVTPLWNSARTGYGVPVFQPGPESLVEIEIGVAQSHTVFSISRKDALRLIDDLQAVVGVKQVLA